MSTSYGQFCPIAKANEIIGEKWTILIIRELLMGARRFNELQRGLGLISPALLTQRLKSLENDGLIVRRQSAGGRGSEYYPTSACEQLLPVLVAMGEWGMKWARQHMLDEDFDADFLMLYMERSIDPSQLPGQCTVIRFHFKDLDEQKSWWVVVEGERIDLCLKDPGRDVDVYLNSSVRTLTDLWMGDASYKTAIENGDLEIQGPSDLTRNVKRWLRPSVFGESDRVPYQMAPAASA